MGMTTHIMAFRPPDKKWKEMKKVLDTCKEAGIDVPGEVWDFLMVKFLIL